MKRNLKYILLPAVSILAAFLAPLYGYSLDDAINEAVIRNKSVQIAERRVDSARKNLLSAAGNFLPVINLGGNITLLDEPASALPGGFETDTSYTLSGSAQLTLFAGGRNSALLRTSSLSVRIAEESLREEINNLTLSVTEAYYNAILSEKMLRLNRESEKRLKAHLEQTRKLFENGLAARFDLLRAEVQLTNISPSLIQAENMLRTSRARLSFLTGVDDIIPAENLDKRAEGISLDRALDRAAERRPELAILNYRKKLAAQNLRVNRSLGLPNLSATYNHRVEHPYRWNDEWGDTWTVGLSLNIPFFRGFKTYVDAYQSRSQIEEVRISYELMRDSVLLEVETAYYSLREEEKKIESLEKTLSQAEEALSIAETRYTNGLITHLEFMDTELSYMRSHMNLLNAYAAYNIAGARLLKASGGD